MSEVDDRIVSIQFDNASFQRRLEQTLRSLEKLSESLRFAGAQKGIQNASNALNGFDPSHMSNAIDGIAKRFTNLGIVGAAALASLTFGALNFAKKVGSDILGPIISGGTSRAKNLEQARFLFEGIGIDVEKGMDSALKAVKGTAFGLDEAAKTAAQFGASGIKVGEQMTSALRGVAGVAALTGRSFSEMGDIFASSAATGVVNNQDLQQFATRGLNAAAALGKVLGKTEEQIHEMASSGELDFKTFADAIDKAFGEHATSANKTYTGSLANMRAAFSRLGASFIAPHLTQQRDLFNALTPVIDSVAGALLPLINAFITLKRISVNNLIKLLENLDVKNFKGGISNLATGFVNLYKALKPIAKVFKTAFHEIFAGSLGRNFLSLTLAFKNFTEGIKIGGTTLSNIKSIFKGFFSVVEIGVAIFKGVVRTIGDIVTALFPASKGLLSFGASTGDFLTRLNDALVHGGGIRDFFIGLSAIITRPIEAFNRLKDAVVAFFNGINFATEGPLKILQDLRDKLFNFFNINVGDAAEKGLGRIGQRLEQVHGIWDKVQAAFTNVKDFLQPVLDYMVDWFKSLGDKLAGAFHKGDFNAALDIINVALLGGIAVMIKKFVSGGALNLLGTGFTDKIHGAFDALTGTLQSMQAKIKADVLVRIAKAVAILVASLFVLSLIDSKALTKALAGLTVAFGELIGAMVLLDKLNFAASIVRLSGLAAAMILIAGAAVVLSIAIKILSTLDMAELAKGLGGVAVGLGLLVASIKVIGANTAGLIAAGSAMVVMAIALNVMALAVKSFAKLDLADMAKGLTGVGVALAGLVAATRLIAANTAGLFTASVAMIGISLALIVMSKAVKSFSSMPAGEMVKGFVAITAAMVLLVTAANLIAVNTAGMISASIAMIGMSFALTIMAKAIKSMGSLNMGTLAKGLGAVAVVLLLLVVATNAMSQAAGGAVALIIVAHAMKVLAKVLTTFANISLGDLLKGLFGIAAVLALLGIAAAALQPVIPALLGLGAALGLLGVAFALFGFGATLVAKAFEIMANSGAAGAKGIVEALKILITALPAIEKAVFDFAVNFAKDILKAAPLLLRLFQALVEQILETVIDLAPKFAEAAIVVIQSFLLAVRKIFPDIVQTGVEMLLSFLQGIRDNIGEIATTASEIMINFMDSITENLPALVNSAANLIISFLKELGNHASEIVTAGADVVVQFLNGISRNVGRIVAAAAGIITSYISALGKNSLKVVAAGFKLLTDLLKGISDNIIKVANTVTDIITKFITSIGENAQKIIDAGASVLTKFIEGIGKNIQKVINKGVDVALEFIHGLTTNTVRFIDGAATMLENFLNNLAEAIRTHSKELREAGINIATAILEGVTFGMSTKAKGFFDGIVGFGKKVVGAGEKGLEANSPSKAFIRLGESIIEGLILPIKNDKTAEQSIGDLSDRVTARFHEAMQKIPSLLDGIENFQPTITPVLDLTKVKDASGNIAGFMKVPALTPEASFNQARGISHTHDVDAQSIIPPESTLPSVLTFEQNNYSPTALSTNDIYRNTKGQIALAKEKLGII